MYCFIFSFAFRYALFTSPCQIFHPSPRARATTNLKLDSRATGENVSLKSKPGFCLNPLATVRARNRTMYPSSSTLGLNTHFVSSRFAPSGSSSIGDSTPFLISART
ncbi:hypothetical protein PR002_g12431 [Phytophthora rubi]|uniref:Secreted protein n=1 Tax=Phytophthora rubi TaxID=129364 RepID=A0A6A3LRU7_9STRA|nr:hypothetical protein PR002_g12431 [Phytophthora rubi]